VQGGDSAITQIDSAALVLRIDKVNSTHSAPIRFDLYDVDTTAADTSLDAVRALFRGDRLIGGATLDTNQIKDTTLVALNSTMVLDKILNKKRLRIGIRVSSTKPVGLIVGTANAGRAAVVQYDPSPDTAVKALTVPPMSQTPLGNDELLNDLTDFQVVVRSPQPPAGPDVLRIGGLEGRRAFLRFNIPSYIVDSSTVLRATLLAFQRPVRGLDDSVTFTMQPQFVTAGKEISDVVRSALLVASLSGLDSLRLTPADTGLRQVEMVAVLRAWSSSTSTTSQRALVLRSALEGTSALEMQIFSTRAAPALRPRLRVSYATRTNFGIP
jgi:hypothetical protein